MTSQCRFMMMNVADVCDWITGSGVSGVPGNLLRRVQHKVLSFNLNGEKFANLVDRDPHLTELDVEDLGSRHALKITQNWRTDFCHIGTKPEGKPDNMCGVCPTCRGEHRRVKCQKHDNTR